MEKFDIVLGGVDNFYRLFCAPPPANYKFIGNESLSPNWQWLIICNDRSAVDDGTS